MSSLVKFGKLSLSSGTTDLKVVKSGQGVGGHGEGIVTAGWHETA